MTLVPPGWYPDPTQPSRPRWWDGASWAAPATPPTAPPSQTPPKRPNRALPWLIGAAVLLLLAAVAVPVAISLNYATAFPGQSPAQVNTTVYNAAASATSFHYTSTGNTTVNGQHFHITQSGEASTTSGIQYNGGDQGVSTVIVIGPDTYLKADARFLASNFNWSDAESRTYANRWIYLAPTDAPYDSVTAAVTTHDYWSDPRYAPGLPYRQTPRSVEPITSSNGRSVQSVTSTVTDNSGGTPYTGTVKLIFSAHSPHLPSGLTVQGHSHASGYNETDTSTGTFSQWNKPVHVTAPPAPLHYSTLPASSPTPGSPLNPTTDPASPPSTTLA